MKKKTNKYKRTRSTQAPKARKRRREPHKNRMWHGGCETVEKNWLHVSTEGDGAADTWTTWGGLFLYRDRTDISDTSTPHHAGFLLHFARLDETDETSSLWWRLSVVCPSKLRKPARREITYMTGHTHLDLFTANGHPRAKQYVKIAEAAYLYGASALYAKGECTEVGEVFVAAESELQTRNAVGFILDHPQHKGSQWRGWDAIRGCISYTKEDAATRRARVRRYEMKKATRERMRVRVEEEKKRREDEQGED